MEMMQNSQSSMAKINGLSTAVPKHVLHQGDIVDAARQLFAACRAWTRFHRSLCNARNCRMSFPQWIIAAVVLQRLAELVLSRRNTARLLADGGVEAGARHYPLVVAVHAGWLGALFFLTPADAPVSGLLLGLFLLLQIGRVWVIFTLGARWTTRVIVLPDAPLVKHGPYRWLKHPNYFIVCAEIAVLPLVFGQWQIALFFSLANFFVLF